jgi:hypothetical protein
MNDETETYSGPEKRIEQRRKEPDRRDLIRYERKKPLRRKNNGRRAGELKDIWEKS